MLRVVLVEPEGEINLGFILRLCRNFAVRELYLVNPRIDPFSEEVRRFAARGAEFIDRKRVIVVGSLSEALRGVEVSGCTTALVSSGGDVLRHALSIEEFVDIVKNREKVALVFGRESVGLTREELSTCTYTVHIPANPEYPTLNLSHAVAIALYVFYKHTAYRSSSMLKVSRASEAELGILEKYIVSASEYAGSDDRQKEQMKLVLRRLVNCYPLSKAEVGVLTLFFRRAAVALREFRHLVKESDL
ncbi:MAG: rRNA methyltransferase [Thermoprotei archaeon]|nr:MAG: rRNA methyltransferase [Thermoprotei archaeon]